MSSPVASGNLAPIPALDDERRIRVASALAAAAARGVTHPDSHAPVTDGPTLDPELLYGAESLQETLVGYDLGTRDTTHGVTFGDLTVKEKAPGEKLGVAIKPFANIEAALKEYEAIADVKERGFSTLEPLGLIMQQNGEPALITAIRDDINTLDNLDWTVSPEDLEHYRSEVEPALFFIASTLAEIHAKGVFHGDPHPKNIVISDTGQMVLVDLESTHISRTSEEYELDLHGPEANIRDSRAYQDVRHAWYALTNPMVNQSGNVFLEDVEPEIYRHELEAFIEKYLVEIQRVLPEEQQAKFDAEAFRSALLSDPLIRA